MIAIQIDRLVRYGLRKGLIEAEDRVWVRNSLMDALGLTSLSPVESGAEIGELTDILNSILDWAYANGRLESRYADCSDLLDTRLMGCLTPRPSAVTAEFNWLAANSPQEATDWFYRLSRDCHYIRTDRVAKNRSWKVNTLYGELDITINCSKPEKDPKAIAAAASDSGNAYPACLLCLENVGYPGRAGHPARQNLRVIPVILNDEPWYFQYSPYVYYNEHAIIFSEKHTPMAITRETFVRLLDFTDIFPHYFIGSNADLPIVGGSMLTHDHYQGGRYSFAMERASVLRTHTLRTHPSVTCSHLNWPLSTLRLRSSDRNALLEAADNVRRAWERYSDIEAEILCSSGPVRHNTLTPIARRRGMDYEMDLVLRNNRQDERYPEGIFHPHQEIHAVKKENIGLIEVMGLAVLPDRLVDEMAALEALLKGTEGSAEAKEADYENKFSYLLKVLRSMSLQEDTPVHERLQQAVGAVFLQGLEHCGVYDTGEAGQAGMARFLNTVDPVREE